MAQPNQIKHEWVAPVLDSVVARRVQTLGSSTDFSEEKISELGNSGYAEVTDEPTVSVTLDTNDWGTTNTVALMCDMYNTNNTTRAGGFKGSVGDNTYVITQSHFEDAAVDITAPISEDGLNLDRTLYMGYCFPNSISLSYDVGGIATENYGLETDFKRWYLGSHMKAIVYTAEYSSATTAVISDQNLGTGYTGLLVTVNGVVQADQLTSTGRPGLGSTITLTNSGSDTNVTASPALELASGDRIRVIASTNSNETMVTLASTPDGLGGARKGHVEIYLSDDSNTTSPLGSDMSLRVQSVSIDVDLSRETLDELGNYRSYNRALQTPVPISATLSVNDSDLTTWANLSQLDLTSVTELDINDFVKTSILEVRIFKDKQDHTIDTTGTGGTTDGNNTLLKVVRLENCSVASENTSYAAGSIGTQEFSLTAEDIIISGTGLSPLV